jgi:hypothetical protein
VTYATGQPGAARQTKHMAGLRRTISARSVEGDAVLGFWDAATFSPRGYAL